MISPQYIVYGSGARAHHWASVMQPVAASHALHAFLIVSFIITSPADSIFYLRELPS